MPANLENSAVATGLEKVSFHQRGSLPQTRRGLTLLSQLCRDPAVGEIPVAPGVEHFVLDTSLGEVYFALQ